MPGHAIETQDTGFGPDPEDAVDVLAFVLCPAAAFAPGGNADDRETVNEVMLPVKTEAVRRWAESAALKKRC